MEQNRLTPQDVVEEVREGRKQIGTMVNPIELQDIKEMLERFSKLEYYPYQMEIEQLLKLSARLFENIKTLEDKCDELVAMYLMKTLKIDSEAINIGRAQINVGF